MMMKREIWGDTTINTQNNSLKIISNSKITFSTRNKKEPQQNKNHTVFFKRKCSWKFLLNSEIKPWSLGVLNYGDTSDQSWTVKRFLAYDLKS